MIGTIPIRPQQNKIAKRMKKNLNERVSMRMHIIYLSKTIWVDAVDIAAYLIKEDFQFHLISSYQKTNGPKRK